MSSPAFGASQGIPSDEGAFAKPEGGCQRAHIYANDRLSWRQKIEADLLHGWWQAEEGDTWHWIDFHAEGYAEMVKGEGGHIHFQLAMWRLDTLLAMPVLVLHADGFAAQQRYLLAPDCEGMTFVELYSGRVLHFRHEEPIEDFLPAGLSGSWQRAGAPSAEGDMLGALRALHLAARGRALLLLEQPGRRVVRQPVAWRWLPKGLMWICPLPPSGEGSVHRRLSANRIRPMVWQVRLLDSGELLVRAVGSSGKSVLLVR